MGEWTRARMEAWLVEQALEGMLRAVEERDDPRLATLQGKTAVAELWIRRSDRQNQARGSDYFL